MFIKATTQEVVMMAKLAILAARPAGLGFLHARPESFESIDITVEQVEKDKQLYIDYYNGRMTKFHAQLTEQGWSFPDNTHHDYQSWKSKYDTYADLYQAACLELSIK